MERSTGSGSTPGTTRQEEPQPLARLELTQDRSKGSVLMSKILSAPPESGTCPAPVCGRDEIDLTHPGREHRMEGAYHVWLGVHSVIVMDCRDGSVSPHRIPRTVAS